MTTPNNPNLDPGAPFSQEAEEATIGSILIDPTQFTPIHAFLKAEDFFLLRHQYIYNAMKRIQERHEPIDLITVAEELDNQDKLEAIGGRAYLLKILDSVGTSIHAEVYAHLVERTSIRRKLMVAADEIKKIAMSEDNNIDLVVVEAQTLLSEASERQMTNGAWLQDVLSDLYDKTEYLIQNKLKSAYPSGFVDLDALLGGGVEAPDLTIVAGRPSMGKSSFLICWVYNLLDWMIESGNRFTIFCGSTETSQEQFARRLVSIASGVMDIKIRTGNLKPDEARRFTEQIGDLSRHNLYIDDTSGLTPMQLESSLSLLRRQHDCKIAFMDGMYEMKTGIKRIDNSDNETAKYGRIAKDLKAICKNQKMPLIVTHQLNRGVENRSDKRPRLSDLRSSGDIEQAADKVLFVYRDEYYNENTEFPNQADIIVAKQRNGATGVVALYFEKSITKFQNAATQRILDTYPSEPASHWTD